MPFSRGLKVHDGGTAMPVRWGGEALPCAFWCKQGKMAAVRQYDEGRIVRRGVVAYGGLKGTYNGKGHGWTGILCTANLVRR